MRKQRLFCLDLLRGLDMFYLACVSVVLPDLFAALGAGPWWAKFFVSHQWYGFTLYDIIMPLFIFMSGAAVPFALGRRLDSEGRPAPGYWRHVLGRFVFLWIAGMFVQGRLRTFDLHQIGFYTNTLQTIAVGYLAAAAIYPLKRRAVQIAIPLILLVVYGFIIHLGGDYTKAGNISQRCDLWVWTHLLPADNAETETIRRYGYSWILPSMMFPVITLAGCFSTEILRSERAPWRKAGVLALFGAGTLAVGWILALCGIPVVKHIFSVSFTLQAIGWSVLLLAALYVLTDIRGWRKGTGLFLLFGQTALVAYFCESLFQGPCRDVAARLMQGLARFFPEAWGKVVLDLGYVAVVIAVVIIWRGYRQAVKQEKMK